MCTRRMYTVLHANIFVRTNIMTGGDKLWYLIYRGKLIVLDLAKVSRTDKSQMVGSSELRTRGNSPVLVLREPGKIILVLRLCMNLCRKCLNSLEQRQWFQ